MKIRYFFEFIIFKLFQFFLYPFPRSFYIKVGKLIGSLTFKVLKSKRNIAIENLKLAFGKEMDEKKIKDIAKKCFQHFGFLLFDLLWLMKKGEAHLKKITKIKGLEIIKRNKELGNGIIALSAHFGNWEVIPHALALEGFPVNSIARKFDNPFLDRVVRKFRERYGNKIIYKEEAKKEVPQILKRGGCIGILADQNTLKNKGVFVDFFGAPACTSTGLALFHLKYGSPILPIFAYPDKDYNYIIEIKEPIKKNPEDDVLQITQRYTKTIEEEIRRNPHLWLWIHNRWKEKP